MKIFDNTIPYEEVLQLNQYLLYYKSYFWGEFDNEEHERSGMVYDIDDVELKERLESVIFKADSNLANKNLVRAYVNLFQPFERPKYHVDGNVTTCLFYINPKVGVNEDGATYFFENDRYVGIPPTPGRLVIFDGNLLHRASTFNSMPRISVAFKYEK